MVMYKGHFFRGFFEDKNLTAPPVQSASVLYDADIYTLTEGKGLFNREAS